MQSLFDDLVGVGEQRRRFGWPLAGLNPPPTAADKATGRSTKHWQNDRSPPNVIEIKLDLLIDDMRLLRSQMIAYDRQLQGIEASLNSREPSEQQPDSKSRRWFAAAAIAMARTVLIFFAVGAATSAVMLYLGT
jgi:hypothetical protein